MNIAIIRNVSSIFISVLGDVSRKFHEILRNDLPPGPACVVAAFVVSLFA